MPLASGCREEHQNLSTRLTILPRGSLSPDHYIKEVNIIPVARAHIDRVYDTGAGVTSVINIKIFHRKGLRAGEHPYGIIAAGVSAVALIKRRAQGVGQLPLAIRL